MPIQVVRYGITVVPISCIFVSAGLDTVLERLSSLKLMIALRFGRMPGKILAVLFFTAFFLTGPLPYLYARPNNFTNHSVFQESYQTKTWEQSYSSEVLQGYGELRMGQKDIPDFYRRLSVQPDVKSIIEYPVFMGDHFNLFYFYQHFHRKNIVAGYLALPKNPNPSLGRVYADMFLDFVLSKGLDKKQLKFYNLIDMLDIDSIKKSGSSYIVLHKLYCSAQKSYE